MITPAVVSFPACANMSVDEAAVDYWLKELVPASTQVPCQLYQQCAKFLSALALAQDLQVAKRIIALLLVNELRNLGDLRHADPPHEWMWAERLSPDSLEHLQQLQSRARQECNFVAPTAKKRARQISRCVLVIGAVCLHSLALSICTGRRQGAQRLQRRRNQRIFFILHSCMCVAFAPFARLRSFVLDLTSGNADTMPTCRPERVVATGVGPRATLVRTNLQAMYPHVKKAWVEEARLTAILGNRASTLKSLRSGVCCYITFIGEHLCEAWLCVQSAYLACFNSCQMHVATRAVPTSRQSSTCC